MTQRVNDRDQAKAMEEKEHPTLEVLNDALCWDR